jgi:hypothetical protein
MHARDLRCLLAAAMVAAAAPAAADPADSCTLPGAGADPLADRAGLLAQYEQLPQACLQEIVTACTAAASETLLDFGTAAACSFGYEALLKQRFGGNFRALMAWWREERGQALP